MRPTSWNIRSERRPLSRRRLSGSADLASVAAGGTVAHPVRSAAGGGPGRVHRGAVGLAGVSAADVGAGGAVERAASRGAGWVAGPSVGLRRVGAAGVGAGRTVERPGGGGHVGVYAGETADAYCVLGGNQGDAVSVVGIAKRRLLGARQPVWRIAAPANRRVIRVGAAGPLSTNEA